MNASPALVASGMLAIARRDLRLFLSYRARVVTFAAGPLVGIVLFHYVSRLVGAGNGQFDSAGAYFAYVVAGIVALQVLTSTLGFAPVAVRTEMLVGTFERLVTSPLGPVASLSAILIFPTLQALVVAVASIAFAALAFGFPLELPQAVLAIPAGVLGALAFAPLALLSVAATVVLKQAAAAAAIVVTAMSLVAGVYFPVDLLPGWIRWTSQVQPFTPAMDLLRRSLTPEVTTQFGALEAVARLAGFALVGLPVGLLALHRALRVAQRRGTVTEW